MNMQTGTVLKLAAGVAVGVLAWQAIRKARGVVGELAAAVAQGVEQAKAEVTEAWNNATGTFVESEASRMGLHSDEGYAGILPETGEYVLESEWYSTEIGRRYEAELRAKAGARGGSTLPVTGQNGAAFGVYPKP